MSDLIKIILDSKATGIEEFGSKAREALDTIDEMDRSGAKFGRTFPAAMIAGALALGKLVVNAVRTAQALTEMSDRSQRTRKDLQALGYAADATGTDFGTLQSAVENLSRLQGEIQAGIGRTKENIQAFERLGISLEDLRSKSPEAVFVQLTKRLESGVLTTEQYAAGVRLLGENFKDLIPAAKDGLGSVISEFENSALKINEGTLDLLDALGDRWKKYWGYITGLAKKGTVETAGGIVKIFNLVKAAELNVRAVLGDKGAAAERDRLLEERAVANMDGGSGERDAEAMKTRLANRRAGRENREKLAAIRGQITDTFGDDAEDVLADLEASGARLEDYERALRRGQRLKRKESNRGSGGAPAISSDVLNRIGLFVGGSGSAVNVQRILERSERELKIIRAELKAQTNLARVDE